MEQVRFIVAIVLSFLIFMVWNYFFVTPPDVTEMPVASVTQPGEAAAVAPSPVEPAPLPTQVAPGRTPRTLTIETPLYTAVLSDAGANFVGFSLKEFRESMEEGSGEKELVARDLGATFSFGMANHSIAGLKDAFFRTDATADRMRVTDAPRTLTFSWVSTTGVVVEKRYTFRPETYLVDCDVAVKNAGAVAISDRMAFTIVSSLPGKRAVGFEGPSALVGKELLHVKTKKIEDKDRYEGDVKWVALQSRYFLTAALPETVAPAVMRLALSGDAVSSTYQTESMTIHPGATVQQKMHFYAGPKRMDVLKATGFQMEKVIDFGWFDILAKPCLWLLNQIHKMIPNYGIAIILLTIFVKLLFWPLGNKSYRAMNDMKKLQPIMAEIREKYGDDKQRINEETMRLYKTYKVNPASGCLPMVAQMPIFIALYRMLYEAIELRHAPFFGWIQDLSAPDRLFDFGMSIPFMQPPYGIPVLTIVMGATMLLQQKMSPPAGDPTQAKMMMLMPLIFTVIFINFPAGLVVYWLVNNVLSIAQQYYIMKTSD